MAEARPAVAPASQDPGDRLFRIYRTITWWFLVLMLLSIAVWQIERLISSDPPLPVLDSLGGEFALPGTWQIERLISSDPPLPVLDTLGGEFALPGTLGAISRLADFRGDVVLLTFGYTGCPDVCPTVLSRMRDVIEALPAEHADRVRPVFITLDPARDTVDRLVPYLGFFGGRFVGLTGSEAQIGEVASAYKVFVERVQPGSHGGGPISHSTEIYLLDGEGRVRTTLGPAVSVSTMVQALEKVL
jgi:protein SCO1/2